MLFAALASAASLVVGASPRERTSRLPLAIELRNFHEVDPGRFYRSGQLSAEQLGEAIRELGIRSVVNLRGAPRHEEAWHREQVAAVRRSGARHYDVRLSARRIPHRSELLRLLGVFQRAERPILVHCGDGADRAGEAAAIYAIDHMGFSNEQALRQLTLSYLHFSWWRPAKRYFVSRYRGARWAWDAYFPCRLEHYDRERFCRDREPGA
jgi:protein tyrosine/serine phosphatase